MMICDQCGARWVKDRETGQMKPIRPKEGPDVPTPTGVPFKVKTSAPSSSRSPPCAPPAEEAVPKPAASMSQRRETSQRHRRRSQPPPPPPEEYPMDTQDSEVPTGAAGGEEADDFSEWLDSQGDWLSSGGSAENL